MGGVQRHHRARAAAGVPSLRHLFGLVIVVRLLGKVQGVELVLTPLYGLDESCRQVSRLLGPGHQHLLGQLAGQLLLQEDGSVVAAVAVVHPQHVHPGSHVLQQSVPVLVLQPLRARARPARRRRLKVRAPLHVRSSRFGAGFHIRQVCFHGIRRLHRSFFRHRVGQHFNAFSQGVLRLELGPVARVGVCNAIAFHLQVHHHAESG
mmetsp:Transcript_40439/g.77279  ORF Transcript_40439/g.77279 Transcript_40439/m.77279 type:complete len:206 (-) Transcript_40439:422-1039(-)